MPSMRLVSVTPKSEEFTEFTDFLQKKILVEAGVELKKRIKCPKSDEKKRQQLMLNRVRKSFFKPTNNLDVVMDDERYFTTDGSDNSLNDKYFAHELLSPDENVKYKSVAKFPKKAIVWVAMSSKDSPNHMLINRETL